MTELIRTCKRCGHKYQGWNCPSDSCRKARKAHNASSSKSRARNGSGGRMRRYSASAFHWSTGATSIGPIHPDACPPNAPLMSTVQMREEGESFPDHESHPDW